MFRRTPMGSKTEIEKEKEEETIVSVKEGVSLATVRDLIAAPELKDAHRGILLKRDGRAIAVRVPEGLKEQAWQIINGRAAPPSTSSRLQDSRVRL